MVTPTVDPFTLVVPFRDEELQFDAQLRRYGYSHNIIVNINGTDILFEPDEERNYRALLPDPHTQSNIPAKELVEAVVKAIEAAFKH